MLIRKAKISDNHGIAHVRTKCWQDTYKGLLPDVILDNLSVKKYAKAWRKHWKKENKNLTSLALVAENLSKEIIGFASGGRARELRDKYDCEIYAVYILKKYQKKRLGSTFVSEMVEYFLYEGFKSMIIWVLAGNSASLFYEKLGGKLLERDIKQIGEKRYPVKGYVWKDISKI